MNFAESLKKHADESGRKVVQGQSAGSKPVEKAGTKNALAASLQKHKQNVAAPTLPAVKKPEPIGAFEPQGIIKTWSLSALHDYEKCPGMSKRKRHPEKSERWDTPENPAAERGTKFHDSAELWVRGEVEEMFVDRKMKIEPLMQYFEQLRDQYEKGMVQLEEEWGFRTDWSPCGFFDDDTWGRGKLDFFVRESETSCVIGDYKTGQRWNNTVKHADQGVSYALQVFHRYPEIEHFRIEFWYIDDGSRMVRNYTRRMLAVLLGKMHERASRMTNDKEMRFKPSQDSCRFCSYGRNTNKQGVPYGNGYCEDDYYARPAI